MWTGDGWQRTQRQLGVFGLLTAFVVEVGFGANVPIAIYSIIGGLLGLDVIVEALDRIKPKGAPPK